MKSLLVGFILACSACAALPAGKALLSLRQLLNAGRFCQRVRKFSELFSEIWIAHYVDINVSFALKPCHSVGCMVRVVMFQQVQGIRQLAMIHISGLSNSTPILAHSSTVQP